MPQSHIPIAKASLGPKITWLPGSRRDLASCSGGLDGPSRLRGRADGNVESLNDYRYICQVSYV